MKLRALLAATLTAVPLAVAVPVAHALPVTPATSYPLVPAHNIPAPSYTYSGDCQTAPTSPACTALFVRALNEARAVLGEPAYKLPARFAYLNGRERLLVLTNQDRRLYGRVPLSGLNYDLNVTSRRGVENDRDPAFVQVNGQNFTGGASNWAGGTSPMTNPLFAYYLWMFDDGPGSGNIDCRHAGDPGCWGHRKGHLAAFGSQWKVLFGVGGGTSRFGYSWTDVLESFPQSAVTPLVPTVTGLNLRTVHAGDTVHVSGFGLSHADTVTIAGRTAKVLKRAQYWLDVRVPAGSGSGYLVVTTNGGTSSSSYASAIAYA